MDTQKPLKKESKKSRRSSKASPGQHKIVEYSDVSSNELSAPEQGEIPSDDGLSAVSDDEIAPATTAASSVERIAGSNNVDNSIYEPIDDDDDEELEKIMDADRLSGDSMSDPSVDRKRKKSKKKPKKGKKSKKKKKRRRHNSSDESIEEISDDEAFSDHGAVVGKKTLKPEPGTPPLDQISYTPKYNPKYKSPPYCHVNDSSDSIISVDKKEYSSPHTPPMPKKVIEESSKGRNSSLSSSTSNKVSSKKRRTSPPPEQRPSKDYRVRVRSRSPYEYESRRYERERSPYRQRERSPYSNSHKYRSERRRRSR